MSAADEARAEAERRYPADAKTIGGSAQNRRNFIAGAEWQASRPISDEQVGAAAHEIDPRAFDLTRDRYEIETDNRWDGAQEFARTSARTLARQLLEAARGVQS